MAMFDIETGIFVRIKRDGRWDSLDIGELTEDEIDQFIAAKTEVVFERSRGYGRAPDYTGIEEGWNWFKTLLILIRGGGHRW